MGFLSMIGRIIPADAGSTSLSYSESFSLRDHPRGCGEHTALRWLVTSRRGSSPRMRGALLLSLVSVAESGIIPADAGSTLKDPCNPNNMIDKISDF